MHLRDLSSFPPVTSSVMCKEKKRKWRRTREKKKSRRVIMIQQSVWRNCVITIRLGVFLFAQFSEFLSSSCLSFDLSITRRLIRFSSSSPPPPPASPLTLFPVHHAVRAVRCGTSRIRLRNFNADDPWSRRCTDRWERQGRNSRRFARESIEVTPFRFPSFDIGPFVLYRRANGGEKKINRFSRGM